MKLLDTSVVVDIDRGGVDEKVERLDDEGRHAVSAVTLTELRLGVNLGYDAGSDRHEDALAQLERLYSRFEVRDVTRSVATEAADVIAELRADGTRLADLSDVYIAATALSEGYPVLTANVSDFDRVENVDVVDWGTY